jgi:type IV pilus assembly protein PilW
MSTLFSHNQKGLSLIELMVAMLISLILLGGVLQVFLSSKNLYNTNTAVSRVQENGRFATEFLSFDIRQAGYKGECLTTPLRHLDINDETQDLQNAYSVTPAIQGWDGVKPSIFLDTETIRANTDSLIVKYAGDGLEFTASGTNPSHTPSITAGSSTAAYAGQIVILANSTGCDIFQNANNTNSSAFQKAGGNVSPGNINNKDWSQSYSGRFSSYILRSNTYYIRDNNGRLPSLVRKVLSPTRQDEELIEGVIDMQVTYGIDRNGDRIADEYVKAGTNNLTTTGAGDWDKVVSARVSLLVISPETNVVDELQQFVYPAAKGITKEDAFAKYVDGTVTIKSKRLAQVFTTTVAIRNRLP